MISLHELVFMAQWIDTNWVEMVLGMILTITVTVNWCSHGWDYPVAWFWQLLWQWIDVAVGEVILWHDFDNYCDSGLTWTGVRSSFGMLLDSYCDSDWAWFWLLLSHWNDMGRMPDGFMAWLYIATQWTDTEVRGFHGMTVHCYTVNWHRGEMVSWHDCTLLNSELTQRWDGFMAWLYIAKQWTDTEVRWFHGMTVHC